MSDQVDLLAATPQEPEPAPRFKVYTDGGLVESNPSLIGGTWAFVILNDDGTLWREDSGFIPVGTWGLEDVRNNVTEMVAAMMALRALPDRSIIDFYTDSLTTLRRVVDLERAKWGGIPDKVRALTLRHAARLGGGSFVLVAGHPNKKDLEQGYKTKVSKKTGVSVTYPVSIHNVRCDELCTIEARAYMDKLMEQTAQEVAAKEDEALDRHHESLEFDSDEMVEKQNEEQLN